MHKKYEDMNKVSYAHPSQVAIYDTEKLKPVEVDLLKKWLPKERSYTVLDIGCGTGRTSINLHRLGHKVTAVDYVPEMIERAKQKYPEIDFKVADATNLPFDSEKFEVSLFSFNGIDCLYPEKNRNKALAEMVRVTKKGGLVILSSHNSIIWPRNKYTFFWWLINIFSGKIFTAYRLEYKSFRTGAKFIYFARRPSRQIREIQKYGLEFLDVLPSSQGFLKKRFRDTKKLFLIDCFDEWPYMIFRKK